METMTPTAPLRLLLELWREVCRHLEIEQSVQALAPRVAEIVPIRQVVVRRLDRERGRLDTVAVGGGAGEFPARTMLGADALAQLAAWGSAGRARAWRSGASDGLRELLCPVPGAALAGPLLGEKRELVGVLCLIGDRDLQAHAEVAQSLLEPFAVALANDQRLHELARLREAAAAENRALLSRLQRQDISESIVGAESGLREVMERVDQVARTDAPVIILGETGSGKEVVARAIHSRSSRASGPFLRINCGAIPPELVDSELFGHERGSFTGAVATRRGWFERADGGTLFLDELGELPAAAQVRLLRVLQDGSFERVGGQVGLHVDVRIVAATHREMHQLVEEGRFRQDLWYRVSVFPIRLPPLRERHQDIASLASHFAEKAGLRLHGVPLVPSAEDIAAFVAYGWPGNVRELAAVIERAAILGDGKRLDVPNALGILPPRPRASVESASNSLEDANRDAITGALKRAHGRIEGPFGAARTLGVNPHTLRSRMRKLGIDWSRFREDLG